MADLGSLLGSAGIGGNIGKAVVALELDTAKYQAELNATKAETSASTSTMGGAFGQLGGSAGLAMGIAGAAVVGFAVSSVKAFMEAQQVMAQTEAVLESTGGAANVTADQVVGLASTLRDLSGVDDEAIQASENLLLTFRDVRNEAGEGNDIFNQTEKAVLDMATAINQGAIPSQDQLKTATIQLGKAMNNPIAGMSALMRVGVSFSEAQKTQIERMQDSGDLMGAQKIILAELTAEFGGAAKAAGDTFAGRLAILQSHLGDVQEQIGRLLIPVLELLVNGLEDVATVLLYVTGATKGFDTAVQDASFNIAHFELGIASFFERFGGNIPIIGEGVKLWDQWRGATDEATEAVESGGKGLGNFRGRFFELQVAAGTAGDAVAETGRTIRTFAGMTGDVLTEWRKSTVEAFNSAILKLEDLTSQSGITAGDFAAASREMRESAQALARTMREIREEQWIPDAYVKFLSEQGPEWLTAFTELNRKQKENAVENWEASRGASQRYREALDTITHGLRTDLDGKTTKHTVEIHYRYVDFDPSKPGMQVSGRRGGQI